MIEDSRIQAYIESLGTGNGGFLDELEGKCIRDRIPIIRPSMQSILKVLIGIKAPKNILEVGTATPTDAFTEEKYVNRVKKVKKINDDHCVPVK